MTLEEYYIAKSNLKAPFGLSFPQEREWYITAKKELQEQLSKEDLEIVLARQREWQRKMQSSVG